MCTNLKTIPVKVYNRYASSGQIKQDVTVPCGHCLECQKVKQNSFAFRCMRVAEQSNSMYFLTLTYRPDKLPICSRPYCLDKETGEQIWLADVRICERETVPEEYLSFVENTPKYTRIEPMRYPFLDLGDGLEYGAYFSPSLDRRSVRLAVKRWRVQLQRHGCPLSQDFKYTVCGEYGENYGRPHMHCLFFNVSREQINDFVEYWQNEYGVVDVKSVPMLNADGSNARLLVSKYVSKYVAKGKFADSKVRFDVCERERVFQSLRFGTEFSDNVKSFYYGFDIVGHDYDLDNIYRDLDKAVIDRLVPVLASRLYYSFHDSRGGRFVYSLPSIVKKKLYYVNDVVLTKSGAKKVYRSSELWKAISSFIQSKFREDAEKELRQNCESASSYAEIRSFLREYNLHKQSHDDARVAISEFHYLSELQKSEF